MQNLNLSSPSKVKIDFNLLNHEEFQSFFLDQMKNDMASENNPPMSNTERITEINNNLIGKGRLLVESPLFTKKFSKLSFVVPSEQDIPRSPLLKLKMHIINALRRKLEMEEEKDSDDRKLERTSHSKENHSTSTPPRSDWNKIGPVLMNNLKMFINKLKRFSYQEPISFLEPENILLINDLTYFQNEKSKQKKNILQKFHFYCVDKTIMVFSKIFSYFSFIKIFHPYNNLKLVWDVLLSLTTVMLLFYVPLSISFDLTLLSVYIKLSYLVIICLDILIQINTSYFDQGMEVKDRRKIIANYMKTRLIPDFLSLVGYSTSFCVDQTVNLLQFLYFFKLLTLDSVHERLKNRFRLSHKHQGIKDLILLLFVILLFTHILACSWALIADPKFDFNKDRPTWLKHTNIDMENVEWYFTYLYATYWAFITVMTVGYGDITPQNWSETLFASITILIGCMVYAYSINCIGTIIQDIKKEEIKFNQTLSSIDMYMNRKSIKAELQTRIREYLKFIWKERQTLNVDEEQNIINSLPNSLKEELLVNAYGFFLKNNPLFTKSFSEHSLRKLVSVMKEISLTPDDVIYSQNNEEEDVAIYFIRKGSVNIYAERNNVSYFIKELKEGEYFGELSFFTNLKRENSAVSNGFVTLIMIKKNEFLDIIKQQKDDYEMFRMIKDKVELNNDFSSINKKCFGCRQFNHIIEECPKIHYIPNQERIIKTHLYPCTHLERCRYVRSRRKKVCALKIHKNVRAIAKKATYNINFQKFVSEVSRGSSYEGSISDFGQEDSEMSIYRSEPKKPSSYSSNNIDDQKKNLTAIKSENENESASVLNKSSGDNPVPLTSNKHIGSFPNFTINDYNNNNAPQNDQLESKGESVTANIKEKQIDKLKIELISQYFERAGNFQNYYPKHNIETLIKNHNSCLAMEKDIKKKSSFFSKYDRFKIYSFYYNQFIERIYSEKKKRRRSKTKPLKNRNKSMLKRDFLNSLSPTRNKKSYFHEGNPNGDIKNFGDLMNNLLKGRQDISSKRKVVEENN